MKKYLFVFMAPILLQLGTMDIALAKNSGTISCSSISRGDQRYDKKLSFRDATLSNAGDGFNLSYTIQGRGDTISYKVTSELVVQGTDYSSTGNGELNSKLIVKKNGTFSFTSMPRSQQTCRIQGTLSFGKGAKQKIFGSP